MDAPKRILLIRPSALGDVCRSVPALASLRAAYPRAEIDWLVRDSFADAISAHPMLTRIVPFERGRLRAWWRSGEAAAALRGFLRGLRAAEYDLVIDLQGLARSGLFAWATRARRRVGFADAREWGWLGLNERVRVVRDMHTVDRMLGVLEGIGVPPVRDVRLYTRDEWRERAASIAGSSRYALLAPTSAWEGKRWPAERFQAVAARLLEEGTVDRVVLVGGRGEQKQCESLAALAERDPRVVDTIGRTSVGELMALVEGSAIVIANDSAAAHMAVGFDRPLVCLFGPTRVEWVGPYGREGDVLSAGGGGGRSLHKRAEEGGELMRRIGIDEVLAMARERLTGAGAARV